MDGGVTVTIMRSQLDPTLISEDYWPDMSELAASERHPAPGFTLSDGSPATLYSADHAATVLRHFQWMQAWEYGSGCVL
jgi:hypothetical protein